MASSTIYSTRFAGGIHTGAAGTFFTVPNTQVAIIKCITAYNAGSSADAFEVSCQLSGLLVPIWHISNVAASSASQQIETQVVLNPGEFINVATGGQPWSFTVNGYLLNNG